MKLQGENHLLISRNANQVYWEQGLFPTWSAINTFKDVLQRPQGHGVEPHYHDNDEMWLFTRGCGEVWLDGVIYEVTPNTAVYTPMGTVHRFQMFTEHDIAAIITPLERQKRPTHVLVEEAGPPEPTVRGFVVPGPRNTGAFPERGTRCPLTELRCVRLLPGEQQDETRAAANEYWLVMEGAVHLVVDGVDADLSVGDLALIRMGAVRRIGSSAGGLAALARE